MSRRPDVLPGPASAAGLTLAIDLLTGSYDAARADDREVAEWPPHPSRLFCALVAAARTEPERAALRWLETQEEPQVYAADPVTVQRRQGYVVTNARDAGGGHVVHPGRTAHLRVRVRTLVTDPTVYVRWPAARPRPEQVEILDRLARRVPYLGRSTGIALLSVRAPAGPEAPHDPAEPSAFQAPRDPAEHPGSETPQAEPAGPQVYQPCPMTEAEVELGVPYPGYLRELDLLHRQGRPAWEALRTRGYRCLSSGSGRTGTGSSGSSRTGTGSSGAGRTGAGGSRAGEPGPAVAAVEAIVLRFADIRPDGRLTARFTQALRHKAMSCAPDPLPAALHGHCTDGRPHVAFLGLPDAGRPGASGRLRALAVLLPPLPPESRRVVLQGILHGRQADGSVPLHVPGTGRVRLWVAAATSPRRSGWRDGRGECDARPSWLLPSRRWTSVTPVVLDRFPHRGAVEAEVIRSVRRAGLPEPVEVAVSLSPLLPGAAAMRSADLPDSVRARLFRHVSLLFDAPVTGPVLLGAGRYLGVGVLVGG